MPVVLDRLPLPNLTWYTGFSFVLLVFSVYYAGVQVTQHTDWKDKHFSTDTFYHWWPSNTTKSTGAENWNTYLENLNKDNVGFTISPKTSVEVLHSELLGDIDFKSTIPVKEKRVQADHRKESFRNCSNWSFNKIVDSIILKTRTKGLNYTHQPHFTPYIISDVVSFMFHEPLCIWTLINMAYCILILLGTAIQHVVFGELRVSEQQHIKDKFWNFVFYKFIFVFGVMNVQAMDGVVLWCSWFSVLGFLHLLAQLCEDRFEYLSFSLTTPKRTHMRLLGLLGVILFLSTICLFITVIVGFHAGLNTFAFMAAECILLMMRTLYIITRYFIYLWDISHEGLWEKRGRYIYLTELIFELSELTIDMIHHIHMVIWANMLLTMASLVICMQIRLLFYQLQHKIKSHRNYMRVVKLIKRFPEIRKSSIALDDETCAICWEGVYVGRLLDCNHIFHSSCLLSWLHHDMSCPTCRHKLLFDDSQVRKSSGLFSSLMPAGIEGEQSLDSNSEQEDNVNRNVPSPNSPDGSSQGWRYVSWLSSFSVEQSHTQLLRHHQTNGQTVATSQLDNLARQVHQMFTDVSYLDIYEDLRHTRSIEMTIENILENKLHGPPPMFTRDEETNDSEGAVTFLPAKLDRESPNCDSSKEVGRVPFSNVGASTPSDDTWSVLKEDEFHEGICTSSRFSKDSREREAILAERKENLLSVARLRFKERHLNKTTHNSESLDENSNEE